MISEKIYTGDGSIVTYQVDWKIPSSSHVNVYVDDVIIPVEDYSIINNSIRFLEAPIAGASIVIRIATSIGELEENPSGTSIVIDDLSGANTIGTVALNIDNVNTVGTNLQTTNTIGSVATNIGSVASVGSNIGDVTTVAGIADDISLVVDNLASITSASTAATNAANSALAASNSADAAAVSALSASGSATTATTQAGLASSSASTASSAATTATTQAGIATTKAGEALTSAGNAATSETNAGASATLAGKWANEAEDVVVSGGLYSAYHWAQKASDIVTAGVIDDTTPSLVEAYSSSKVVDLLATKSDTTHTHTAFTGLTVTGLKETSVAMAANNIDLSLGNLFTKTISGATTLTVNNIPTAGTVGYFILQLTNGGSATVTWFSGVKWAGGTAPTLTASGVDVLSFYTIDAGTTWKVIGINKDVK